MKVVRVVRMSRVVRPKDVTLSPTRPWRLAHALHPVLFGCVYAVFSLSYYLAGGTNYHFEPSVSV